MADKKKFRAKHGLEVNTLSGLTEVLVFPESDGSTGQAIITDGSGNLSFSTISGGGSTDVQDATGEPMGHADRTESTISFDSSNRIFTIAPVSTSFDVWCAGTKYTKSSSVTVTLPTTSDFYYIYFDSSGNLQYKTTYFTWHTETPTAYVYYNADSPTESFLFDERHGITLDWQTHEYLHRTRGAVLANGLSISFYGTLSTNDGSSDDHYKVKISNGTFFDEDLEVGITHAASPSGVFEQYISPASGGGKFPALYKFGSSGLFRLSTGSDVTEAPFRLTTSVPQYNLDTSGTWSLANVPNNKFFGVWLVATNTAYNPVIAITGQTTYDNLTQAENNEVWNALNLSDLPLVEYRPLYRLIYEYNSTYTNTAKSVLRHVLDVRELGAAEGAQGVVQNDHGNLFGLGDDDHYQYVHIGEPRTISADHTFSGDIILSTGSIISSSNGNINITPNGTGNVTLGNLTFDADQTVGASQDNYVLAYNHTNSHIVLTALSGGGGPIALDDLTDVNTTGASTGEVLTVQSDGSYAFDPAGAVADDSFINAIIFG